MSVSVLYIYIINNAGCFVDWLVGDHLLLLRDSWPYVIICMNVCVVIIVAM
jgi:hypothetical protein